MTVLRAVPNEDSPETRLRSLKDTRTVLSQRIAELAEARQRLGEAEEAERAAAALAELSATETAAASKWATGGASGAPPAPDLTRRADLVANLSAAQAASAAARGAATDIERLQAELRSATADIAAEIESVALEVMELERITTMNELCIPYGSASA